MIHNKMILLIAISILASTTIGRISLEDLQRRKFHEIYQDSLATEQDVIDKIYLDLNVLTPVEKTKKGLYDAMLDYMSLGTGVFNGPAPSNNFKDFESDLIKQLEGLDYKIQNTKQNEINKFDEILEEVSTFFNIAYARQFEIFKIYYLSAESGFELTPIEKIAVDNLITPAGAHFNKVNRKYTSNETEYIKYMGAFKNFYEKLQETVQSSITNNSNKRGQMVYLYGKIAHLEKTCSIAIQNGVNEAGNTSDELLVLYKNFGIKLFACITLVENYPTERNNFKITAYSSLSNLIGKEIAKGNDSESLNDIKLGELKKSDNRENKLVIFYLNMVLYHNNESGFKITPEEIEVYADTYSLYRTAEIVPSELFKINVLTMIYSNDQAYKDFLYEHLARFSFLEGSKQAEKFNTNFDKYLNEIIGDIEPKKAAYFNLLKIANAVNYDNLELPERKNKYWDIKLVSGAQISAEFLNSLNKSMEVLLHNANIKHVLNMSQKELLSCSHIKFEWIKDFITFHSKIVAASSKGKDNGEELQAANYQMELSKGEKFLRNEQHDEFDKPDIDQRAQWSTKSSVVVNQGNISSQLKQIMKDDGLLINKIGMRKHDAENIILLGENELNLEQIDFIKRAKLQERINEGEKPVNFDKVVYVQVVGSDSDCMKELIKNGIIERAQL